MKLIKELICNNNTSIQGDKAGQLTLPHKCVNIELHSALIQSLGVKSRHDIYKTEFQKECILQAMYDCHKYLMPMETHLELTDCNRANNQNYMLESGGIDIQPLTARQSFCANATIKHIIKQRWSDALHEFLDCIDNFGECEREPRFITLNESILYSCLIQAFISALNE